MQGAVAAGMERCGVWSQPDILWAQDNLKATPSMATTHLAVPLSLFFPVMEVLLPPLHSHLPQEAPRWELPVLGAWQPAVVCGTGAGLAG